MTGKASWNKLRLIIAHDRKVALETGSKHDSRIQELKRQAAQWVGKLDYQDAGKPKRGRKLSDGGARARFYHEVCEVHLAHIVRVDLQSELLTHSIANAQNRFLDRTALGRTHFRPRTAGRERLLTLLRS